MSSSYPHLCTLLSHVACTGCCGTFFKLTRWEFDALFRLLNPKSSCHLKCGWHQLKWITRVPLSSQGQSVEQSWDVVFPHVCHGFPRVFPWFSARHHMSPSTGFPSWSTGKPPKPWTTTQTVPHLRGKISLISQLEQLGTAVCWPIVVQRFLEFLFCQSVNNRLQRVFVTYTWAILVKSLTVVNSMLVVKWIWGLVDKNKSSNIW